MSLKRILGTMLATRMAGRGRRPAGLGTTAMLGGLGYRRRRRGIGGKLGMAALGYMAYRAYQDNQSRSSGTASGTAGGTSSGGSSGGIAGMVRDVADRLTGARTAGSASGPTEPDPDLQGDERAADAISDDTALLLIRAMITAAYSDGALSDEERARIMQEIDEGGGDAADRSVMEREIADPKPLDELLAQVHDQETAQEFYLASRAAVDAETTHSRAYLDDLRQRLGLSDEDAAEVEEMAS